MAKTRKTEATERMKRFADAYFMCLDPIAAMKEAGYNGNEQSLASQASQLLRDERVQAVLRERRERLIEKTDNTMTEVIGRLKAIADSNIKNIASWKECKDSEITFKASATISDDDAYAIKKIRSKKRPILNNEGEVVDEATDFELELHSKEAALKLLASYYGIDSDWNSIIAGLARFGLTLKEDANEPSGWKIERKLREINYPTA